MSTLTATAGLTSAQTRSHRRLAKFVDWIKPDATTRANIEKQAPEIRKNLSARADADGLNVRATPDAGSFAKHTGLRRHMRGGSEIEGQDVDLPFVVDPVDEDGRRIAELLRRFSGYAKASYPTTPQEVTNSSVEMEFVRSQLYYDIVPMLVAPQPGYQIILKKDGSRRTTSVAKHTEFVRSRTRSSDALPGRVKFNECVRLLKWWRYERIKTSGSIEVVRTTLIELLCASAYDRCGVEATYTATLLRWFSWLASVTELRQTVEFTDYPSIEVRENHTPGNQLWRVIDPVNANNNVVHSEWGNLALKEFAGWFADGRDSFGRLVAQEAAGNDCTVDTILEHLFGSAIANHGALK
jgi:hypothetical protein